MSNNDCLEDKIITSVLCYVMYDTVVHNDTQTHMSTVLKAECWFRFRYSFCEFFEFTTSYVFLF